MLREFTESCCVAMERAKKRVVLARQQIYAELTGADTSSLDENVFTSSRDYLSDMAQILGAEKGRPSQ